MSQIISKKTSYIFIVRILAKANGGKFCNNY